MKGVLKFRTVVVRAVSLQICYLPSVRAPPRGARLCDVPDLWRGSAASEDLDEVRCPL